MGGTLDSRKRIEVPSCHPIVTAKGGFRFLDSRADVSPKGDRSDKDKFLTLHGVPLLGVVFLASRSRPPTEGEPVAYRRKWRLVTLRPGGVVALRTSSWHYRIHVSIALC